jgi:hypothetical protein
VLFRGPVLLFRWLLVGLAAVAWIVAVPIVDLVRDLLRSLFGSRVSGIFDELEERRLRRGRNAGASSRLETAVSSGSGRSRRP